MAPAYYDLADMFQEILIPRQVEGGFWPSIARNDTTITIT